MKELWNRVLLPLLVPLGALAIIAVVVLNISACCWRWRRRAAPRR